MASSIRLTNNPAVRRPAVVDEFLSTWKSLDAYSLAGYFARGGQFAINDEPPACGPEAIRRVLVHLLARVVSLECVVIHRWQRSAVAVVELDLHLLRDDGQSFTAPATFTFWTQGGSSIQRSHLSLAPEPNWPRR